MNAFVTGSDTGVGKTHVTGLLTRSLRRAGFDTVALKPVCCGSRDDVGLLCAASDNELSLDATNPIWFREPLAPLVAARMENREVDMSLLEKWFNHHRTRRRSLLVEGAGGWLVPLAPRLTVADLAAMLALPVIVVVANRLGCLNHTLLTLDNIRARGLTCSGLVLNTLPQETSPATKSNKAVLEEIAGAPILFDIKPHQTDLELAVA